jgi:outer membrane receptor for ferrienterochelin and colicins
MLNWEYIGEQYMAPNEQEQVPGYSLVDLTFALALNELVELRAGITNLGDVRLADKSEDFGDAEERGRFYFAGVHLSF